VLSFRVSVDGAQHPHHQRVRAVLGATPAGTLTGVGRLMRATGAERLPRLVNVLAGQASFFSR
jgi:lipopolysaccharide/colanic/teichoic acid biosynthesis glycosyltransferase